MFAARVKSQLKKAREELGAKRYEAALEALDDVLYYEPDNVNGLMFKAAATQNLDRFAESRAALERVLELNPALAAAWQGLEKLFEKTGDTDRLVPVVEKLRDLHIASGDGKRLADALERLVDLHSKAGDWPAAEAALRMYLPGSPARAVLESPPEPAAVLMRIADMHEAQEAKAIADDVKRQRALLGAPPLAVVQARVERDVALKSQLLDVYEQLFAAGPATAELLAKYIACLRKRIAVTDDATRRAALAATLRARIDEVVKARQPIAIALQFFLDLHDAAEPAEYPRDVLEFYVASLADAAPAKEGDEDEYLLVAKWILDGNEPADLVDPQSMFGATVTTMLSSVDDLVLSAGKRALALAADLEASMGASFAKAKPTIRLRRAQALVLEKLAHEAIAELNAPGVDPTADPVLLARGDALALLGEHYEARKCFASVRADSAWAQSSIAWLDFVIGDSDADTGAIAATLAAIDASSLTGTPAAVHHFRVGRVAWAAGLHAPAYTHLLQAAQLAPQECSSAFTYLGLVFAARGDPERAAKCWSKAVALDKADHEAADHLSAYYVGHQQWDRAIAVLEASTAASPRVALGWKRLGMILARTHKCEEAAAALQTANRVDGDDHVAWQSLGEVYLALGKFSAALKVLLRSQDLVANDTVTNYLLADAYCKLGQYTEATALLDPSFPPSVLLAGEVYSMHAREVFNHGRFPEVARLLTEGIAILEANPLPNTKLYAKRLADLRVQWSLVPHHCPDYAHELAAAADLYSSVELWTEAGIARYHAFEHAGDASFLTAAEADLRVALGQSATAGTSPAWTAVGCVYAAQGRVALAQHAWIVAAQLNSSAAAPWLNLGFLYLDQGDRELAAQAFQHATLLLDLDEPAAWIGQAMAADAASERGAEILHHAWRTGAWHTPALARVYLANAALRQTNAVEAEVAAHRWTEYAPSDAAAWIALGCAQERTGNARGAVAALKTALKLDRSNAAVIGNLARCLAASDPKRAIDLLRRVPAAQRDAWGWSAAWTLALAEHHSAGHASPESLAACLAYPADTVPPAARVVLAQLLYRAGETAAIPSLVADTAPAALCALGMVTGDETHIAAAFAAASPTETQYLTSIYQVLQGDLVAAQRALERAVHMFPGDPNAVARLARFLVRYSGARAQVPLALAVAAHERGAGEAKTDAGGELQGLALATSGLLAAGHTAKACRMAQRHAFMRPSSARAWRGVVHTALAWNAESPAAVADETLARIVLADPSPCAPPDSPNAFAHLLTSAVVLALGDPAVAMQHAEAAVAAAGVDVAALPAVYLRQLARVLATHGEADAALAMLKRAIDDAPAAADPVAGATRAAAWLELADLYRRVGWVPAAAAALDDAADHLVDLPASARAVIAAAASVAQGLSVPTAQHALAAARSGEAGEIERSGPLTVLEEQARGLVAVACARAGFAARATKMMAGVARADLVDAFLTSGGAMAVDASA
ncbi:Superkiller protein 3 [Blastocladiella emersonii ATCC 22665]|nr:Superkiller protein 3 [Blastocladiella emersonii ATCC 22665]